MAGHRLDLSLGTSGVGESRRSRFPQPVSRTILDARAAAGLTEPVPKPPAVKPAPACVVRNNNCSPGTVSSEVQQAKCSPSCQPTCARQAKREGARR